MRYAGNDDQRMRANDENDENDDGSRGSDEFSDDDDDNESGEADEAPAAHLSAEREQLSRARSEAWLSGPPPNTLRARRLRRRVPGPRPPASDIEVAPGRIAIAQGQVYIIGALLIVQLFLITTSLYELLSGRSQMLWPIAGGSLFVYLIALVVALWPRRSRDGF